GTIDLDRFASLADLRKELASLLFHAVVGTSRLPLHSVEAPLPAFSFGELFYCFHALEADGPATTTRELLSWLQPHERSILEQVKLLETLLHAVPGEHMMEAAVGVAECISDPLALLRTLFNEVSLSPWT